MAIYILFDTETTGNQEKDRIIQIGGLLINSKKDIEVYDELCNTPQPISIEAMEVHNITPDLIADKPLFGETRFFARLRELNTPDNYLIAHNIAFDLGMLQKEGFENRYTLIDTLQCAKHLLPDLPYHRLQYLRYALDLHLDENDEAQSLGVTIKAHDAIGDVIVMKLLLSQLVKRVHDQDPLERDIMGRLAQLTITPVLMKTFKFGKYKGRDIEEIAREDMGYLAWMRKNLELDKDMKYTLEQYL
jgi:exodeoxyribonuclease X